MAVRLPPLNSLRAFEAAARHASFVKAAAELHVTPAAVSHQVKALEDHLGATLFKRLPRGLVLTEQGRACLPDLSKGFAHLVRAVQEAGAPGLRGPLPVSVMPSFAALWLVPRLQSFFDAYPDIELRVHADTRVVDFAREDVDLAVRHGRGDYPGLSCRFLLREEVFPVCAPSLLNRPHPLRRLDDLRHHTLLHDINVGTERSLSWRHWLGDAGVSGVDSERGPKFSDSIMLTEAAVRGQGVALGRTALVADHLASGRLVRPLPLSRVADYAYYVVMPDANTGLPRVRAFVQWLEEQVAAGKAALGGSRA
jgi:LysR family transcriptional regulator, glycine cleavage system transcriptional activator